jgi:phospholipid/cholesterol/gamma-HCH transport system substrate-binding protein
VKASRLFEQRQKLEQLEPAVAVAAFNDAFGRLSRDVIGWTATAM